MIDTRFNVFKTFFFQSDELESLTGKFIISGDACSYQSGAPFSALGRCKLAPLVHVVSYYKGELYIFTLNKCSTSLKKIVRDKHSSLPLELSGEHSSLFCRSVGDEDEEKVL
jgi:hypothetical protein